MTHVPFITVDGNYLREFMILGLNNSVLLLCFLIVEKLKVFPEECKLL